jgi:beta-glucanase (GH16 family)
VAVGRVRHADEAAGIHRRTPRRRPRRFPADDDHHLAEPMPIEPPEGMELVWSDEFDGDTIDRSNWTYDIGGWGWGNGEAQYYTDRPENARSRMAAGHRGARSSSRTRTTRRRGCSRRGLQEFQYGRIEARIKVPPGRNVARVLDAGIGLRAGRR